MKSRQTAARPAPSARLSPISCVRSRTSKSVVEKSPTEPMASDTAPNSARITRFGLNGASPFMKSATSVMKKS